MIRTALVAIVLGKLGMAVGAMLTAAGLVVMLAGFPEGFFFLWVGLLVAGGGAVVTALGRRAARMHGTA